MLVSVGIEDGLSVQIEIDLPYSPDALDDACTRARDLFRLAMTDAAHLSTEHE